MSVVLATGHDPAARQARRVLWMSTFAFTVCFAVWTLYAILALKIQDELGLTASQFGTLLAVPVLVGALTRLPVGMLTDRFGGRKVFTILMLLAALPTFGLSFATTYAQFVWLGAGFGLAGAGFAVGNAYVSVWSPREKQGTALGIFGVGNVGSAVTSLGVPFLLASVSSWRVVPQLYAAALALTALVFYLTTYDNPAHHVRGLSFAQRLAPLKRIRVWRFGLYYALVFGGFMALGLWLPNYYKNVYGLPLEQIALITMAFLLPASLIRALGGWLSDRFGGRKVLYGVLGVSILSATLLSAPPAELTIFKLPYVYHPASYQQPVHYTLTTDKARQKTVATVKAIGPQRDPAAIARLRAANPALDREIDAHLSQVEHGALAPTPTRQVCPMRLELWSFTVILFVLGVALGVGKAAVYRLIPDYFPREVGLVGGIVGMIGALGGFFLPLAWGYVLEWTGLYSVTIFGFIALLSVGCLAWLHHVVSKFLIPREARLATAAEDPQAS